MISFKVIATEDNDDTLIFERMPEEETIEMLTTSILSTLDIELPDLTEMFRVTIEDTHYTGLNRYIVLHLDECTGELFSNQNTNMSSDRIQ